MIPDVGRALEPLAEAVYEAQSDLDDVNGDSAAHPLDSLAYAGRVIKAQEALIDRCWELLDAIGKPVTERDLMLIHGRIRAAHDLAMERIPR